VTPLQFAQALAADLATLPLPAPAHGQLGEIVVPCAGTYVSVVTTSRVDPTTGASLGGFGNCDRIEMAVVSVVAARDCADVANQDGSTNWVQQDVVSTSMDVDGQILWDWSDKMLADAWYTQPGVPTTVTYQILGALQMVVLGVQLPVP